MPVDAVSRCAHRIDERGNLAALIVTPGGVSRFCDPDLRFGAMLKQNFPDSRDLRIPTVPPKVERAGKTMNADGIDVLHDTAIAHELDPPRVHRTAGAE